MSHEQDDALDNATVEALGDREPVDEVPSDSSWAAYMHRDPTPAANIDEAPIAQLDSEAVDEASDKAIGRALRQSDVKAAKQAHKMRKRFYRFVVRAVFGTLAASALTMLLYVVSQWGTIDAAVMVAFFSAVVVQVIGLAYIIARYLFAPRGPAAQGVPMASPAEP